MGFLELTGVVTGDQTTSARVETGADAENASGGVHGGLIATLIDAAMGRTVREGIGDELAAVTVQLSITYLNGAELGDTLVAEARIGKQTKTLALVEADVTRESDGEAIAHGIATFAITRKG